MEERRSSYPNTAGCAALQAILRKPARELPERAVEENADRALGALEHDADLAAVLHETLLPVPAGSRLEARLAARLAGRPALGEGLRALGERARRELLSRERLLVAGAVSSAAVGVGVTAYAVWHRSGSRRS